MKSYWKHKLTLLFSILLVTNVYGDTLHPLDSIEQAAYEYALLNAQEHFDSPQVMMGTLDSRLRLQQCESGLEVFSNVVKAGLGNQTIGVKCTSPVAWTVYVPVKVKVFKSVVVAAKSLAANEIISATDIKLQKVDISTLHKGYLQDPKLIIGQELKYSVAMGRVLRAQSVEPQKIVHRGDHIMLLALAGALEVKMRGIALSDASLGQRVRVKNSSSKRIVEGVVEAAGIVKVTM